MGRGGKDDAVEVRDDLPERFRLLGRVVGECAAYVTRRDLRQHRVRFNLLEVSGRPLNKRVRVAPELVRRHVAKRRRGCGGVHHDQNLCAAT